MISRTVRIFWMILVAASLALVFPGAAAKVSGAGPVVLYAQLPDPAGGLLQSSRQDPDGSSSDQFVWDAFSFHSPRTVTEIRWRGGFDPMKGGSGGPVVSFIVSIYASIPAGTQPDISIPALVEYLITGDAGQTLAGTYGSTVMYDYTFVLPASFQAAAGTVYWVQIEANQQGAPDWGLASASAGDGSYFLQQPGAADKSFHRMGGDSVFTLLGDSPASFTVSLPLVVR